MHKHKLVLGKIDQDKLEMLMAPEVSWTHIINNNNITNYVQLVRNLASLIKDWIIDSSFSSHHK